VFACLSVPSSADPPAGERGALEAVARGFSPRVDVHAWNLVTLDVSGLQRLLGAPADIGRELLRDARARGCDAAAAIAATRTAATLLALACDGLTVVPPGRERAVLASLPLGVLARLPMPSGASEALPVLALFRRWGLRILGDLARLPSASLSERIGQEGLRWQRAARGEDLEPLVAMAPEAPIEEALDLDWPVEGLEPLSFLLPRLLEPICDRLERLDRAAVTLDLSFRLATREQESRRIQLPAPMRDAKVLRTLVLLHLESHPLAAGVDRLAIAVETAPARIVQFSLLARALPFPEQMATLLARLGALMGERRVGAAAVVDSYRPGAFAMQPFKVADAGRVAAADGRPAASSGGWPPGDAGREPGTALVLRRFRLPIAARVVERDGRPVRVTTERRGLEGGNVESSAGPWRTSGEWWRAAGWNRDEWDVALSDGAVYRVSRDRSTGRWFVEGVLD
jgi:protein ImuB